MTNDRRTAWLQTPEQLQEWADRVNHGTTPKSRRWKERWKIRKAEEARRLEGLREAYATKYPSPEV